LLDVALAVFGDRGFDGTTMSELAREAGVTKPVLYQHFSSKRELFLEVVADVGGRLREEVAMATSYADRPRHQVEAGFAAYFRFVSTDKNAFKLLTAVLTGRDPEFRAAVQGVEEAMAETVAELIYAGLTPEHRSLIAHALVGMAESASRRWIQEGSGDDPEVLAHWVADLAWAGLQGVGETSPQ
jgi:AcrR family transcriptional regulator